MKETSKILKMAKENNGIVTSAMVDREEISRGNLKYLVDSGQIVKSTRGVYTLPEIWEDEFMNLQHRFKRGIFSHETALFLHDLSDRTPNYFHMTFQSNYNLAGARKEKIRCTQVIEDFYELGVMTVNSPGGNKIRVYNKERTLCDILRPRSQMDIQIVTDAFKRYAKQNDKNIPLLLQYAKLFKVEEKIRSYLEVLL